MARSHLFPCPSCGRHVRAAEASCPFCRASLAGVSIPSPRQGPGVRLTRAALVAFGTGGLALSSACSSEDVVSVQSLYGGAPLFDAEPEPQDGAFSSPDVTIAYLDATRSDATDASVADAGTGGDAAPVDATSGDATATDATGDAGGDSSDGG
jgi:hypothetical protein